MGDCYNSGVWTCAFNRSHDPSEICACNPDGTTTTKDGKKHPKGYYR